MTLIGIIIIIVLVHFLIIRPLSQRNRSQIVQPRRNYNQNGQWDYYGSGPGGMGGMGMGRFGTFAGGLATGALLTYLFEQGRIGFDQYQAWQNLGDHELLRELQDQNILQQEEIDQLQEEIRGQDEGDNQNDWDADHRDNNYDEVDYDPNDQQGNDDFGGWDNGSDDNWV